MTLFIENRIEYSPKESRSSESQRHVLLGLLFELIHGYLHRLRCFLGIQDRPACRKSILSKGNYNNENTKESSSK